MTAKVARRDDEVILGTFLVNGCPAMILFDAGASKSFVSPIFCAQYVFPCS